MYLCSLTRVWDNKPAFDEWDKANNTTENIKKKGQVS